MSLCAFKTTLSVEEMDSHDELLETLEQIERDWMALEQHEDEVWENARRQETEQLVKEGKLDRTNTIPHQVWRDIDYEVAKCDLEYADNYRAYRVSDGYCREEFDHAYNKGCCGFFQSHTIVDGEKWIIGCNYGH